jgi:hypothetical protein
VWRAKVEREPQFWTVLSCLCHKSGDGDSLEDINAKFEKETEFKEDEAKEKNRMEMIEQLEEKLRKACVECSLSEIQQIRRELEFARKTGQDLIDYTNADAEAKTAAQLELQKALMSDDSVKIVEAIQKFQGVKNNDPQSEQLESVARLIVSILLETQRCQLDFDKASQNLAVTSRKYPHIVINRKLSNTVDGLAEFGLKVKDACDLAVGMLNLSRPGPESQLQQSREQQELAIAPASSWPHDLQRDVSEYDRADLALTTAKEDAANLRKRFAQWVFRYNAREVLELHDFRGTYGEFQPPKDYMREWRTKATEAIEWVTSNFNIAGSEQ